MLYLLNISKIYFVKKYLKEKNSLKMSNVQNDAFYILTIWRQCRFQYYCV